MQETIARDRLVAVTSAGRRRAVGSQKTEETHAARRELLKEFEEGQIVTNGRQKAKVVGKNERFGQLDVVVLPSRRPEKWSPENVTTVPPK